MPRKKETNEELEILRRKDDDHRKVFEEKMDAFIQTMSTSVGEIFGWMKSLDKRLGDLPLICDQKHKALKTEIKKEEAESDLAESKKNFWTRILEDIRRPFAIAYLAFILFLLIMHTITAIQTGENASKEFVNSNKISKIEKFQTNLRDSIKKADWKKIQNGQQALEKILNILDMAGE